MKAGILSLLTLLLANLAEAQLNFIQWSLASGGNGHFYALTPNAATWSAAEGFGVSQGGHLASITSAAEQGFVTATFLNGFFDSRALWIGLTDQGTEGTFRWTTAEPVAYTHWYANEPNNGGGLQIPENYVAINWQRAAGQTTVRGEWNDTPLNGTTGLGGFSDGPYYGLIEVVPEPSPMCLGALALVAFFAWKKRAST